MAPGRMSAESWHLEVQGPVSLSELAANSNTESKGLGCHHPALPGWKKFSSFQH